MGNAHAVTQIYSPWVEYNMKNMIFHLAQPEETHDVGLQASCAFEFELDCELASPRWRHGQSQP